MRRQTLSAFALIVLTTLLSAWPRIANAEAGNSGTVEVFYLTQAGTITTYDVDPSSGTATQVGNPLILPGGLFIGPITPSPRGEFLYILWTDTAFTPHFSVYATDATGVPGPSPVQTMVVNNWQFLLHPSGKFAYVLRTFSNSSGTSSALELYQVDPSTGKLAASPQALHRFGPDYFYVESLYGFSKDGTRLYDTWSVSFDSENNATYSYQLIDQQTGTLSHNTKLFYASNFNGIDVVKITSRTILDLHDDSSIPQFEVLNVYPNVPNATTPKFVCDGKMLDACQNSFNLFVDPAERYLFLPDYSTQQLVVAKVDTTTNQLVQTDSIAGNPSMIFSPDDLLAYALGYNNGNPVLDIYKFDANSGVLTLGQELSPSAQYWLYTAERKTGASRTPRWTGWYS
jgi:hypothetical protein